MDYSERVTALLESNKEYSCSKIAITEVAISCGVSEKIVKRDMKKKKSKFLSDWSGFIDGDLISRPLLFYKFTKKIKIIFKRLEKNIGYKL